MDHLPKTANGVERQFQVPYLVPPKYVDYYARGLDNFCRMQADSMKDFPAKDPAAKTKSSFFESFLAKPRTHKISRAEEELLEAVQIYLYFVFLVEVFNVGGVKVDCRRFFTTGSRGKPIVTTAALTEYICYWHLNVDSLDSETKKFHLDQLMVFFSVAAAWLTAWSSRLRFVDPPPSDREGYSFRGILDCHHHSYPRTQMILLSIRILQETLHVACESAYVRAGAQGIIADTTQHVLSSSSFMQGDFEFVDQLMIDAGNHLLLSNIRNMLINGTGWCPNEIAVLTHRSVSKLNTLKYFLSTINRKRLGRDHSRCNRQRCYKLMEYPYLPEHMQSDCQCSNVFTCREESTGDDLVAIIQRGAIPLIRMKPDASDDDLLELTSYNPIDSVTARPVYTAISHVWSDGRGNRSGNFLPACQIRELQYSVSFAHHANAQPGLDEETFLQMENVYFWIDTLCIPRHHEAERKRAIKSMTDIYQNASSVLVFDKGLLRSSLKTGTDDVFMAIAESSWGRRLWTLQEGRLATKLRFQFADGVYDVDSREQLIDRLPGLFLPSLGWRMELPNIVAEIESGRNVVAAAELLVALACAYPNASELVQSIGYASSPPVLQQHPRFERLFVRLGMFCHQEPIFRHATNKFGGFLAPKDDSEIAMTPETRSLQLQNICVNLDLRRTTEPADEAGSMASLLKADVSLILNTAGKERMAVLLQSLEKVPLMIVFFQGERYEEDGRRWIPKSFLLQNGRLGDIWGPHDPFKLLGLHAQPQQQGLLFTSPGFRIVTSPKSSSPEHCYLTHGTSKYVLTLTEGNRLRLASTDWTKYTGSELAVILTAHLDEEGHRVWSGILVSRRKVEGDVYYCRFEHTIYMHRAENALNLQAYSIQIEWPGLSGREVFSPIESFPEQTWCLG